MDVINAFTAPNPGRIDVAQTLGSVEVGVWLGDGPDDLIFRRDTAVAWADGEDDWNKAV